MSTTQHRCRLYKIAEASEINPYGVWTELWDTLDEPYEEKMPVQVDGQEPFEITADSSLKVRQQMNVYRKQHGIITAGSWRHRGIM